MEADVSINKEIRLDALSEIYKELSSMSLKEADEIVSDYSGVLMDMMDAPTVFDAGVITCESEVYSCSGLRYDAASYVTAIKVLYISTTDNDYAGSLRRCLRYALELSPEELTSPLPDGAYRAGYKRRVARIDEELKVLDSLRSFDSMAYANSFIKPKQGDG